MERGVLVGQGPAAWSGEHGVVAAMWGLLRSDLALGWARGARGRLGLAAFYFLHRPSFARWLAVSGVREDPAMVRDTLLVGCWPRGGGGAEYPEPPGEDEALEAWLKRQRRGWGA